MSANFPPGISDDSLDPASRANATARGTPSDESRTSKKQSGEALRNDLTTLKSDLDSLLSHASTLSERELSDAYARIMTKFSSMRYAAKGIAAEAGRQLNQGVDVTTKYVKGRPLQSVGIATGVGVVIGLLLARR